MGRRGACDRQNRRLLERLTAGSNREAAKTCRVGGDGRGCGAGRSRASLPLRIEVARVELSSREDDGPPEKSDLLALDAEDLDPAAARVAGHDQRRRVARRRSLAIE